MRPDRRTLILSESCSPSFYSVERNGMSIPSPASRHSEMGMSLVLWYIFPHPRSWRPASTILIPEGGKWLFVGSVRDWHWYLRSVETETGRKRRRKGERGTFPADGSNLADRVSCFSKEHFWCRLEWGFRLDRLTLAWNGQAVIPV